MTRRKLVGLSAAALAGTYAGMKLQKPPKLPDGPAGKSAVAIMRARSYSDDLVSRMLEGIREVGLDVRGKRVLLKPNLVEFDAATVINTDAAVIAAALEVFQRLGAREVKIGEGPGHRRDTLDLADDAKYRANVPKFESIFTDLNRDDVSPVGSFAGESEFYFPNTVLGADLIVSLAKMKTHHWAGATLSMKNFFGVVPGSVYGWPKNKLHYLGIDESIVALNRQFRQQGLRDRRWRDRDGRQRSDPGHAETGRSVSHGARLSGRGRHLCPRHGTSIRRRWATCGWQPSSVMFTPSASSSAAKPSLRCRPISRSLSNTKDFGWHDLRGKKS